MTMQHSTHPDDERLAAYASADREAVSDRELAAHISSCERCRPIVDELAILRDALAQLPDIAPSRPLRLIPPVAEPAARRSRRDRVAPRASPHRRWRPAPGWCSSARSASRASPEGLPARRPTLRCGILERRRRAADNGGAHVRRSRHDHRRRVLPAAPTTPRSQTGGDSRRAGAEREPGTSRRIATRPSSRG